VKKKFDKLKEVLERPVRNPDYTSKRGVPYWWAPEWVRDLNGSVCRVVPLKKGDDVQLHMVSKVGNLSYIQGSIQKEFKKWHEDREIDYILLCVEEDEVEEFMNDLMNPEWAQETN
jgi:hypothetical protein